MARTTAQVNGATLVFPEREASPITVNTPAWFAWLEHATTFAFRSPSGHFTARKERQARGGGYWKAYRTSHGTLHRVYLGKAQDLTLDRLNHAATTLAATTAPATIPSTPTAVPSTVLATKLFVPLVRANLVLRQRLLDRLQQSVQGKLTLLCAPAGFGKSTLLSSWIATCKRPAAWLSLDAGDSDPIRFLTYLVAALQTIAPTLGAGVMAVLQGPQPPPAETILTALLNEISTLPDHGVLILDDYHTIDAPPVDTALTFLLEHLPLRLHLVIATREDPSLPLARFRARGDLRELRAADLRFTPAEAAEFLNTTMGLGLAPDDIAALEARTEGWIAGLQLAALSMQGQHDATSFIASFTGTHHFVLDYLLEEVLQRQSEGVQTFLLRTSILDRMCGPLCDVILDQGRRTEDESDTSFAPLASSFVLQELERANLFIVRLDNERRWYRYHHLFGDLLRQRLHQRSASSPGDARWDVAELHRCASQWYEDNGLELEAFQHAAAANDVERAERLIEGAGIPLYFRGATSPILKWLHSQPATVLDARPALWVAYVTLLTFAGNQTVEPKLQAAEAALQAAEPDDTTHNRLGHIAALRSMLAVPQHQIDTIIAQSRRALAYLHPDNLPMRTVATWTLAYAYQLQGDRAAASQTYVEAIAISQASGNSFTTILATGGLGQVQEADNQLALAAESYRRVLQLVGDPPQTIACEAYIGLARILYQWNDLHTAAQYGHQCLQLTQQVQSVDTFASYGVFLARLKLAQGDVPGAVTALDAAEAFVRRQQFAHRMPEIAATRVLMLLRQGKLAAAAQLAETHDLPLSQARIHLAQGDPSTALALLEPVRQHAEAKAWADERLNSMVLQVVALHAHGETDTAAQLLCDALALAQPGGCIRLFVDEGTPMEQLLNGMKNDNGTLQEYRHTLLVAFGAQPDALSAASPPQPLAEPLSQRELEVLRLVSQGLSNREISERLVLALDTVKGHNRRIYEKLQVERRTEAVARARELGLL
jgi:LuxR family transcriptional regulator, maltose regulon positive regulatory protein